VAGSRCWASAARWQLRFPHMPKITPFSTIGGELRSDIVGPSLIAPPQCDRVFRTPAPDPTPATIGRAALIGNASASNSIRSFSQNPRRRPSEGGPTHRPPSGILAVLLKAAPISSDPEARPVRAGSPESSAIYGIVAGSARLELVSIPPERSPLEMGRYRAGSSAATTTPWRQPRVELPILGCRWKFQPCLSRQRCSATTDSAARPGWRFAAAIHRLSKQSASTRFQSP